MSLEKIENGIRDLKAITNYEKVKKENADLAKKVKDMDREISVLRERVAYLENLKATVEGRSLKDAEEAFLRAEEAEIERRAGERSTQQRLIWEKESKPKEVEAEAIKVLSAVIDQLSQPGPQYFIRGVVKAGLPGKVEKILKTEVTRRIDSEFHRRVEDESEKKAVIKLEQLKTIEWPNWLNTNIEPKVQGMLDSISINVFQFLKGPWTATCAKCGLQKEFDLTPEGIAFLIKNEHVSIECTNPKDRHQFKVTLRELIESFILK